MPPKPFKPYGTPPPLDVEEFKDSFEIWHQQWKIFLSLSTINTALPQPERPQYIANILLSCLSNSTLKAVLTMGLSATDLEDADVIIKKLQERCNAGRNCHVWRQQFASRVQREAESIDSWLSDLRDLSRKCEFEKDCCAACQNTRLLGQMVFGVLDDDVRRKLLELGAKLTLEKAITIVRTAEATRLQSSNMKQGTTAPVNQIKSATGKRPNDRQAGSQRSQPRGKPSVRWHPPGCQPYGCWSCGAASRHAKEECPAFGKECHTCHKSGHFQSVCSQGSSSPKTETAGSITIQSILQDDMVRLGITPTCSDAEYFIQMLPDSGASIDAIPVGLYQRHFKDIPLSSHGPKAVTATGSSIISLGQFHASLFWATSSSGPVATSIHVLQDLQQPVVSKETQKKLGMLPAQYPHTCVLASILSSESSVPESPVIQSTLIGLMSEVPSIFDGVCRPMRGAPCHFQLKDDAVPSSIRGSRPISVPLMPKVKREFDSLEQQNVIAKVTEPTAWVHPIVIVPKANDEIRICGDFTSLNRCIVRPIFEAPTPFQAVRTIPPGMKFFTVIDALKGYHQVELDDESSLMTTISTPFGRYKYLRLPFGVSLAGDDYGRRLADVFDDFPNCRRVVEDVLVFSATWTEHVDLVRRLFHLAADHQIAINVKKIVFAQPSVLFGGYVVGESGFQPNPDLLKAIREFPKPTCVSEMRAFHGLCQQVGNFSDDLASLLRPLSPLLRKEFVWEWTPQHDTDFQAARAALSSTSISELAFYNPARPTSLHVDASRLRGLGFILRQQQTDGSWIVVQAGSRFLSDAESRYAMIELECLAAAWAMRKCRQFLEGLPSFHLLTDHRPLIPILNDYFLDKLDNPRILRLRLSMQRYSFTASWVPGKQNVMADALSRSPVDQPSPADEIAEGPRSASERVHLMDVMEGSSSANPDILLSSVSTASAVDPVMISLRHTILQGFPNDKCNLPMELRPFWQVRSQLSVDDDIILVGPRVVIPASLRPEILRRLLLMHQGATKIRQRARQSVYWPSIDNDIAMAVKSCPTCSERLPSHPPEPLLSHEPASRPFEFIFADLGTFRGRDFLIIADQFSGWPQVYPFPKTNTSSRRIIDAFRSFFTCGAGAPIKLWSDGGPQFKSDEYLSFLKEWDISHGRSSPHHPKSNGHAEAAVKSMKKLIAGSWTSGSFDLDKFGKGLLLFRNAPIAGGASPSQVVFNRPTRDAIPAHRRSFAPEWQKAAGILEKRALRARELQKQHYNRSTHPLPALHIGDSVVIQHHKSKRWSTPGVIVEVGAFRDYLIKTPAGRLFRRNRRFLRLRAPAVVPHSPSRPPVACHPPVADSPSFLADPPVPAASTVPSSVGLRRSQRIASRKP